MSKIGVIGDRDAILGFKALGLDVFAADSAETASNTIHHCARNNYAVIFITENFAKLTEEARSRYDEQAVPAIIIIPDSGGTDGYAMSRVKHFVEKAIGTDIIFGERG